ADYNGPDELILTVADNHGGSDSKQVDIAVASVNDAPVTTPVTLSAIAEDSGPRLITQAQLLANASDVDGPSLTAINLAISTGSGSLVNNGNGTWSFTPAANDDTSVTFSYGVTDGVAAPVAATATLDITPVNDAPVLANGSAIGYTENGTAAAINTALAVSDVDNTTLASGTVS